MKTIRILLGAIILLSSVSAQNYWWMNGDSTKNNPGIYGIKGVASPGNRPGARFGALTWKTNGNVLWMFGGKGHDTFGNYGVLNDLWKYNISSNEWTWVSGDSLSNQAGNYGIMGVPAPSNKPRSRESSATWTDASGNLWLFGGNVSNPTLNDVWKYDPVQNEWIWMNGVAGVTQAVYVDKGSFSQSADPGNRSGFCSWTDNSGNLWLFGGYSMGLTVSGIRNDLWQYSTVSGQWMWVDGDSLVWQNGVYGALGVPSSTHHPGARTKAASWKDLSGNLWLFGGSGRDSTSGIGGLLNDIWKYDLSTNEWTWMGGDPVANQSGLYGTLKIPSAANGPGGRAATGHWTDTSGNLYLMGGLIGMQMPFSPVKNDLWHYNTASGEWTWLKGSPTPSQTGVYGLKGVPANENTPGARSHLATWTDADKNLWLFGGGISTALANGNVFNDLWKYQHCGKTILSINVSDDKICSGNSATLSVAGAASHTWSSNPTSSFLVVSPMVSTTYSIQGTDLNDCQAMTSATVTVEDCTGHRGSFEKTAQVVCYPNPAKDELIIKAIGHKNSTLFSIYDCQGRVVASGTVDPEKSIIDMRCHPAGLYLLQVLGEGNDLHQQKIVKE